MKNALWCVVSVLSGRWAVVRARSDICFQRSADHTFGEAHITEKTLTAFVVPVISGAFVFVFALRSPSTWLLLAFTLCVATGLRASLIDIDTHTIPRHVMVSASVLLIGVLGAASFVAGTVDTVQVLTSGLISWVLMRLLEFLSRGDLGHADVVLAGYQGLFLGAIGIGLLPSAIFISFVLAGLVALVMIATKHATRSSHLPFGPFLFVGMVVTVLR